ncbi:MAG: hypothetical protein ISR65_01865 [Bacteriovoracaceae bacterium]|nr:hypothetical protein [Bacteriovoracaceae bacterium]
MRRVIVIIFFSLLSQTATGQSSSTKTQALTLSKKIQLEMHRHSRAITIYNQQLLQTKSKLDKFKRKRLYQFMKPKSAASKLMNEVDELLKSPAIQGSNEFDLLLALKNKMEKFDKMSKALHHCTYQWKIKDGDTRKILAATGASLLSGASTVNPCLVQFSKWHQLDQLAESVGDIETFNNALSFKEKMFSKAKKDYDTLMKLERINDNALSASVDHQFKLRWLDQLTWGKNGDGTDRFRNCNKEAEDLPPDLRQKIRLNCSFLETVAKSELGKLIPKTDADSYASSVHRTTTFVRELLSETMKNVRQGRGPKTSSKERLKAYQVAQTCLQKLGSSSPFVSQIFLSNTKIGEYLKEANDSGNYVHFYRLLSKSGRAIAQFSHEKNFVEQFHSEMALKFAMRKAHQTHRKKQLELLEKFKKKFKKHRKRSQRLQQKRERFKHAIKTLSTNMPSEMVFHHAHFAHSQVESMKEQIADTLFDNPITFGMAALENDLAQDQATLCQILEGGAMKTVDYEAYQRNLALVAMGAFMIGGGVGFVSNPGVFITSMSKVLNIAGMATTVGASINNANYYTQLSPVVDNANFNLIDPIIHSLSKRSIQYIDPEKANREEDLRWSKNMVSVMVIAGIAAKSVQLSQQLPVTVVGPTKQVYKKMGLSEVAVAKAPISDLSSFARQLQQCGSIPLTK